MDFGSLFLILGLFILVVLFIIKPILIRRAHLVSQEEQHLSQSIAEKERLLNTIQELDFDHNLGKLQEEDYPHQREELMVQAAEALRQIDELRETIRLQDEEARYPLVPQTRRSENTRRRRSNRGSVPHDALPDDELEALIAARRRLRSVKAAGFCPHCGRPVQSTDRFCTTCGTQLQLEEALQE